MRLTLEQLKAMSTAKLGRMWNGGAFPFDWTGDCFHCLSAHGCHQAAGCGVDSHAEVIKNTRGLKPIHMYETREGVEQALERYYALRLFYDSLYPQETPAPSPTTTLVADEAHAEVVGKKN